MTAELKNDNYSKTVLDNGIRVITESMPHLRSISIGVWITVGSRDESIDQSGVSHLIEHMVFKGTKNRSSIEIAESLESVGGHLDAFTAKEVTCFTAHILDDHLEIAVDVLSDLILNPLFPQDELEKEKSVIIREINHTLETPDDLIFDYFFEDIYPLHPLGYQISGTVESVSRLGVREMQDFMQQHFTPDRIVITAAGNVQHNELVRLVKRVFNIKTHQNSRKLECPSWPKQARFSHISRGTQAHICLGCPGVAYANPQKYPFLLLNTYLGAGMSSRLFQIVREKYGLAYSIFSFADFFLDTGLFGVYAATQTDSIEQVIDLIKSELKQLVDKSFQHDEIERLKSQLKGNLMLSLESASSRMGRLANMEIYLSQYLSLDQVIQNIEKTTITNIRTLSEELFQQDKFIFTILIPENNGT